MLCAGQKSGHVDERDDRQAERVAEANETRRLVGRVNVETACADARLIGDDADGALVDAREAGDHIRRK